MKSAKRPGRVVATTADTDPDEQRISWGAITRRARTPKTTARTRRGEPEPGWIYEGTVRHW